jgi:hypothetical protein
MLIILPCLINIHYNVIHHKYPNNMKIYLGFVIIAISGFLLSSKLLPSSLDSHVSNYTIKQFIVGQHPGSVEVADFNHDGKPDMAVANEKDNNVSILLGDGKGGFTEAKGSPFPCGNFPNDIAIADLNKDGNLDLALANHEAKYVTVLLGNGHGQFLVAPNSPFHVPVKPHTHGIATGDFNGDGNLDLVTDSWGTDQIVILYGDGKGNFKVPGTFLSVGKHPYQRIRVADLNNDHEPDIVTTNLDGNNSTILFSDGSGHFSQPMASSLASGDAPFGLAIGDVNGDGKPDLAIINSPSISTGKTGKDGLTILLGNGTGEFSMMKGSPFNAGQGPTRVAIGDLNNDGIADIAVTNYNSKNITLFYMNRTGVASSENIPVSSHADGIAIHDLNGDGKNDIVVSNSEGNSIIILFRK